MSSFYIIDNGVIVSGPHILGSTEVRDQLNTGNPEALTHEERVAGGVYPYVENDNPPAEHAEYYDRSLTDEQVNADNVSRDAVYTQWSIERVKNSKNSELEGQIRQYTTNDQAINPKITEYVVNDAKWLADEQAKLARLTDWQAVAGFDTAKPAVFALPNSYVGASYVKQGVALTAENEAAVASGLSAIWDQTEINAFVAGNQMAADDPSNTIEPVKPGYKLRQGVANVSEQFNRVVIYRFDRDDPNPAFRRSFAMQITNRQDNRDLYVFTYTGLTYLAWHKFEDQGDGIWYWEAAPAEWQYTDTDLGFIFSYGTNPAVEANYFTDRVELPAGVEEDNLLVAWDSA